MILPIYTLGQPVLRKVAEDIPLDYPNLQQLIADMFETCSASDGIGLAAPQIGKSIRLVVIDLDVISESFLNTNISSMRLSMDIFLKPMIVKQKQWRRAAYHCLAYMKM